MARYGSVENSKRVEKEATRVDVARLVACCLLGAAVLAYIAPTRPQLPSAEKAPGPAALNVAPGPAASDSVTGCECTLETCCERGPYDDLQGLSGGCMPLLTAFPYPDLEAVCKEVAAGNRSGAVSVCEVQEVKDSQTLGYTLSVAFSKTCAELKGQCGNSSSFVEWSRMDNLVGCSYSEFDSTPTGETFAFAVGGPDTCFPFSYDGKDFEALPFFYRSTMEDAKNACEGDSAADAYFAESDGSSESGFCLDLDEGGSVTATLTGGPYPCAFKPTPQPTTHRHDGAAATTVKAAAFLLPALLV